LTWSSAGRRSVAASLETRYTFANINLEKKMAKAKSRKARGESVYRITELVGTSSVSWEDAAKRAIETAAGSLRDLRVADIIKLDVKVDGGKVVAYRARVSLSFKYEA
jgi:flavin-binding protein dodecin